MVVAIPPTATALPALTTAWATYQAAEAAWREQGMQGMQGEHPRLVLPLDAPHPRWRGLTEAQAVYRAALQRVEAHLAQLDMFDVPSLHRPDIQRADQAIQRAFAAHDYGAVVQACARWESVITGRGR